MITRKIENESHLESLLSEPTSEAIQAMRKLDGDLMLIGVGGKMGPSLARMARRASEAAGIKRRILGVSRFTDETCEAKIQSYDIETIRCDLLDDQQVARLPRVPNLIYMTGQKFGSVGDAARTWAMNTYVPSVVCRHFCFSRIVAFSTGNVYAFTSTDSQGSREEDVPEPVGEYGMSALGRERMFQYFSQVQQMPSAILRLNYACDLRYGVLVDLARKVHEEQPVDLGMGYFNTIWQGDANAIALQAFDHLRVPAWLVNMTGPERLSVREVCHTFARLMGKSVQFVGKEADTALLSCVERANCTLGRPRVGSETLMEWVADWVGSGGTHLGKPTHFEARDGRF